MTGRTLSLLFACCLFCMRASAQEKDTIILYNGQILIGEVQQSNLGVISIDDIDMKIVNIKLFKIKRLVIRERFKIETIGKEFYFGSMRTTDKEGWVDIHSVDGTTIPLRITHIFELISLEHGFFRRMNGCLLYTSDAADEEDS